MVDVMKSQTIINNITKRINSALFESVNSVQDMKKVRDLVQGEKFSLTPDGTIYTYEGIVEVPCAGAARKSFFISGCKFETRVDGNKDILLDRDVYVHGHAEEVPYDEDDELIDLAYSTTYKDTIIKLADQCKNPENRKLILDLLDDPEAVWESSSEGNRYLNVPIDNTDLSIGVKNILRCNDVKTIGDLAANGKYELYSYRCMGPGKIREIENYLEQCGLHLADYDYKQDEYEADRLIQNLVGFPMRMKTACRVMDIYTVDELAKMRVSELRKVRNIGPGNIQAARDYLKDKFGLELAD